MEVRSAFPQGGLRVNPWACSNPRQRPLPPLFIPCYGLDSFSPERLKANTHLSYEQEQNVRVCVYTRIYVLAFWVCVEFLSLCSAPSCKINAKVCIRGALCDGIISLKPV